MLYIKEEFNLHSMAMVEGSIMAMALLGATIFTTFSQTFADAFGRQMMLLALALLSFIAALLVIFRSHHAYMFYS
jgi:cytochrome b subunit of formate dehydrogenase